VRDDADISPSDATTMSKPSLRYSNILGEMFREIVSVLNATANDEYSLRELSKDIIRVLLRHIAYVVLFIDDGLVPSYVVEGKVRAT